MTDECQYKVGEIYPLKGGLMARIYRNDTLGGGPIRGLVLEVDGRETSISWNADGEWRPLHTSDFDLLPIPKLRIKRDIWVNVYGNTGYDLELYFARRDADNFAHLKTAARTACVKLTIDVEDGHGLNGDPA